MSHADFDVPVMSGLPKRDVRLSPWKHMLANTSVFDLAETLPCRGSSGADQGGNSHQEPPSPAQRFIAPFLLDPKGEAGTTQREKRIA